VNSVQFWGRHREEIDVPYSNSYGFTKYDNAFFKRNAEDNSSFWLEKLPK
jgi:hypothetical protein